MQQTMNILFTTTTTTGLDQRNTPAQVENFTFSPGNAIYRTGKIPPRHWVSEKSALSIVVLLHLPILSEILG